MTPAKTRAQDYKRTYRHIRTYILFMFGGRWHNIALHSFLALTRIVVADVKKLGRGCSKTSLISREILTISLTYFWGAVAQYHLTYCRGTDSDGGGRRKSLTRITGHGWVTRRLPWRICHGHSLKYFRKSPRCNRLLVNSCNRLLVNSEGVRFKF